MKYQKIILNYFFLGMAACSFHFPMAAQKSNPVFLFSVTVPHPEDHLYHVDLHCQGLKTDSVDFKMPAWMPGYYQILNYADQVENFTCFDELKNPLRNLKISRNTWRVYTIKSKVFDVTYTVKSTRSFVASNFLDENRAFIAPPGLFIYPVGFIHHPVNISLTPFKNWNSVATGLDAQPGNPFFYKAADFDILFDSPILMGNLDSFPSFEVRGIPHYFFAFHPDSFDRTAFMRDIKKIVSTASGIIGDIPYKKYTFLGNGPGGGGIEHLNSAAIAFSGKELNNGRGKLRTYNFLAHEYFHLYNVKRIRPIELGPFDYDHGSRTSMLWLSEGISVYYEHLIVKRAGLMSSDDLFQLIQNSIKEYELKPGRKYQTPAEASYATWEDGPFGRTGDEVNKTISPYDNGPAFGMMLDFKIRHETKNKSSLDDLMRLLYKKYYKRYRRGFTEKEFRRESEQLTGTSLADFFDYIYSLKSIDYPSYFQMAGLTIDTVQREIPGAWWGAQVRERNDSLRVTNVEYQSPAWNAGLRNNSAILSVNNNKMNVKAWTELFDAAQPGDKINIVFTSSSGIKEEKALLKPKYERSYTIDALPDPNKLQQQILKSWLGENP